ILRNIGCPNNKYNITTIMSVKKIVLLLLMVFPFIGNAAGDQSEDVEFNPTELINSHIGDSHEFHVFDWGGKSYSIPLPVILWTDSGLVCFSSSEFHHDNSGQHIVEKDGQKFVRDSEIIYYADKYASMSEDEKRAFKFESRPLNFSSTKHVFLMIMSVIILLLLFTAMARSYKKNKMAPYCLAGFLEPIVLFVRNEVSIPNIGEKKYAKY